MTYCGRWERRVVHSHQRREALSSLSLSSQGLELPMEPHAQISLRSQRRGIYYVRPVVLERRKQSRGPTYVDEYFLAYWAISSSVFAEARGSHGAMIYPSHALAVANRLAPLMAATIVWMSKSVDRKLGSTMGGSNGFRFFSLTSPPTQK